MTSDSSNAHSEELLGVGFERRVVQALKGQGLPTGLSPEGLGHPRIESGFQSMEEMDVPPGEELLGFFSGIPLVDQSVTDPPIYSGTIFIFQEPLEEMCGTLEELEEEIELTVVHEIAHYFGISEERLEELGYS